MRAFSYAVVLATLVAGACSEPPGIAQPLDGRWVTDSAPLGMAPRTLTLRQRDSTVSGTGQGMGVDVPIPFDITGTYRPDPADGPPRVGLHIVRVDGARTRAEFNGTLSNDRLAGSVVYYNYYGVSSVDSQVGTLSFRRP
jgi:hypothetical protein